MKIHVINILAAVGLVYMFVSGLVILVYLLDKSIATIPNVSKKVVHLKDRIKKK